MDDWDDDEAFRIARDLHGGPGVSAHFQSSATANCGLAQAPMAALDALIETAWSFPGFRVSYGAFDGARAIRFHTSAGSELQAALDCVRLDLSSAPRFVEALRSDDAPVAFEDVTTDSRARPIADALLEVGCKSMVILPLISDRKPLGIVMMDCETPRTWGAKEMAALDRLAPLIALTLEHVEAKAELESTRASSARHERRITAMRGLTAGVASDAARLLEAMRKTIDTDRDATHSLLGQLERLVGELDRVQHSPTRLSAPFDLSDALRSLAPGLAATTKARVRIDGRQPTRVGVDGNRTGIERLLVNLVAHATRDATKRQTLTLTLSADDDGAQLRLHGSALRIDDVVRLLDGDDTLVTSEQVCPTLWQARSEALLQDIRLWVEGDTIVLEFPSAELEPDAKQSAG